VGATLHCDDGKWAGDDATGTMACRQGGTAAIGWPAKWVHCSSQMRAPRGWAAELINGALTYTPAWAVGLVLLVEPGTCIDGNIQVSMGDGKITRWHGGRLLGRGGRAVMLADAVTCRMLASSLHPLLGP
jgi:hypothetical protein